MYPPILSKAETEEPLSFYIAAGPKAISAALIREEKDASGRLVNWAIELSQFNFKFIDAIVMWFWIPVVLVSDNGPQFVGSEFEAYPKELGIKHKRSFMAHPQGNGQVKVTNRTTPRTSTWEIPFKLAYGSEARLPVETGSPSHKVVNFDEVSNIEGLRTNFELLDEVRDQAVKKMGGYKEKTTLYFGKEAKIREYEVEDPILWDTEASDPTNQGKLQPSWERPYKIKEVLRPRT
ncbi:uncharacterized protein LOC141680163 [Apium graveolens]|uniref:uncharacterized protein LOC141680163 n=1 Tax=Apium graveolens TaxID=4045 RepID=UPI003D7B7FD5